MKRIRFLIILIGTLVLVISLNLLLVHFEQQVEDGAITTFPNAIWFMIVTLTTVGYGDFTPASSAGRAIGYIYVLSSLGVLGFLFSTISNKIYTMIEEKKLGFYGTNFEHHIIIVGWNEFSRMVADEISHTDKKMAIITNKKDDVDLIYDQYGKDRFFVLFSEFNNHESFGKVNASKASVVFVSLENDSDSLLYILDFKKNYPQPQIVVSLHKSQLKETFRAAGVTYAIARNEIASKLVASYVFEPDVADLNIDLISTSRQETDFDIQEYKVLDKNPYAHKKYIEVFLDLKEKYDCVLMGLSKVREDTRDILTNPPADTIIQPGDYMLLMSNGIAKKKISQAFGVAEGRRS
ncbi:MAG: potassium channel family protein [Candidatus Cyclobacteriaceae bacterium M3_2C_046]